MSTHLVILAEWPVGNVEAAARAWAAASGGTVVDRAAQLARCRGVVVDHVEQAEAESLAVVLTKAGCSARPVSAALVPHLPPPLSARGLDPRDPEALLAQVAFLGSPERIPWRQILMVLPGFWEETQRHAEKKVAKPASLGATALDLAMTGGLGTLLNARKGAKSQDGKVTISDHSQGMVEIVATGPLRRYQAFANRMDYSVLADAGNKGSENWPKLLEEIAARCRPDLAGSDLLERFLAEGWVAPELHVSDSHDLARTERWLLLRAAAHRLAVQSGLH